MFGFDTEQTLETIEDIATLLEDLKEKVEKGYILNDSQQSYLTEAHRALSYATPYD